MKYIREYNQNINKENNDKIVDFLNYLETWEDEYDDFKFELKEYKVVNVNGDVGRMDSFKHLNLKGTGVIISSEFILPEILWKDSIMRVKTQEDIKYHINIYKRLDTLFTRLESMGGYPVYVDNTFLSNRLRSISVRIFISSDSL